MLIDTLELDEFERGLLTVARHFFTSFETPAMQSWGHAFAVADERWGEALGLAVAYRLQKVIRAVLDARDHSICFHDPMTPASRDFATGDEVNLLFMLHHMRRDETGEARAAVMALCLDMMDPHVIRAGLAFADRFSCGAKVRTHTSSPPDLRVVV
ncbi:MAG: hypothetical protein HRU32_14460 [Rhodobacteraceae bacterium]|nr:hypothetical protein [Paracoccaceae bacterium]